VVVLGVAMGAVNEYGYYNGDKQLNNVVSLALSSLAANGAFDNIVNYFDRPVLPNTLGIKYTGSCQRPLPYFPVGTLKSVIQRGTIRFCLDPSQKGDVSTGAAYAVATEVIEILGVKQGDLYGPNIDMGKIIADEIGLLLATKIVADFTECTVSPSGNFQTIYNCLNFQNCDVSLPVITRNPYMEELVDFTCAVRDPNYYIILGYGSLNVYTDVPSDASICTTEGDYYIEALTYYPTASYVFYPNATAMWAGFCNADCNYVVGDYDGLIYFQFACTSYGSKTMTAVNLPFYTPAGDLGAITLKSSGVEKYSSF